MTRLFTTLVAAVLLTIAVPAGASARGGTHRHHDQASRHAAGGHRHHRRSGDRHIHKRHVAEHKRHAAKHKHAAHAIKHMHATPGRRHATHARRADAGGCESASLRPQAGNLEAVREATLCLVNRERVTRGERALTSNGDLQHAAQGHSESMAFGGYFEHQSPDGSTPLSRMRAAGYIPSSRVGYEVGENIAWGTLSLATPREIVEAWMASPGHRANILDPRYRDTGIGVAPHALASHADGQAGGVYTQDFGVIIAG